MPDSEEGQSYLGRAYLDSWGSLTPCLGMYGMPGVRIRRGMPAVAKQASQNEHLFLPWKVPGQRDENGAWEEQAA